MRTALLAAALAACLATPAYAQKASWGQECDSCSQQVSGDSQMVDGYDISTKAGRRAHARAAERKARDAIRDLGGSSMERDVFGSEPANGHGTGWNGPR